MATPEAIDNKLKVYTGNNGQGTAEQMNSDIQKRQTDPNYVQSQIGHTQKVIADRQSQGLDTSAQINYLQKLGADMGRFNTSSQTAPSQAPFKATSNMGAFNPEAEMGKMRESIGGMGKAYVQQQQAGLDAILSQQITQLESSYAEAVAEGKMSVREAEEQFAVEKAQLEKEAYNNSEVTQLYGQDMGIQNSQQMVGLMQGDQARSMELQQGARKTRDSRINTIKDRIKTITLQKNLAVGDARIQRESGLLKAQGDASMMMNEKLFGLQQGDYESKRNYGYEMDKMNVSNQYAERQMGVQNQYDLGKMDKEQEFVMTRMDKEQVNQIAQMAEKYKYDTKLMDKELEVSLVKMAKEFGYSSSLQRSSGGGGGSGGSRASSVASGTSTKIQGIQSEYDQAMQWAMNELTPGTPEYKIYQQTKQRERDEQITNAKLQADIEYLGALKQETSGFDPKKAPTKSKTFFGKPTEEKIMYDALLQKDKEAKAIERRLNSGSYYAPKSSTPSKKKELQ